MILYMPTGVRIRVTEVAREYFLVEINGRKHSAAATLATQEPPENFYRKLAFSGVPAEIAEDVTLTLHKYFNNPATTR